MAFGTGGDISSMIRSLASQRGGQKDDDDDVIGLGGSGGIGAGAGGGRGSLGGLIQSMFGGIQGGSNNYVGPGQPGAINAANNAASDFFGAGNQRNGGFAGPNNMTWYTNPSSGQGSMADRFAREQQRNPATPGTQRAQVFANGPGSGFGESGFSTALQYVPQSYTDLINQFPGSDQQQALSSPGVYNNAFVTPVVTPMMGQAPGLVPGGGPGPIAGRSQINPNAPLQQPGP